MSPRQLPPRLLFGCTVLHARSRRRRNYWREPPHLEVLEDRCCPSGSSLLGLDASLSATTSDAASQARVAGAYGQLPLAFQVNQGQTDPQVQFLTRGSGYALFLTGSGAVLSLQQSTPSGASPLGSGIPALGAAPLTAPADPATVTGVALAMNLVGANPQATATGLDQLPGISNYFIGNDPSQWHTNIANFGKVEYHGVYPGVNLVYRGNQGQLEYDFVIAPGADPGPIRFRFDGAESLTLDDQGNLVLHTPSGDVLQHGPVVYQEVSGGHRAVQGRFVLLGGNQVGFQVGSYDPALPLTIDPVLIYSTYLGGLSYDVAHAIAVDSSGNAYVAGITTSTNFPTTPGAFQTTLAAGGNGYDAFVTKLNAAGTTLIYSTYLGGNNDDGAAGIAVDAAGNAYITAETRSTNFPTTAGAFQTGPNSALGKAFVTKLNAAGTGLIYSTYLGGSGGDGGAGIAVDGSGSAYVTGDTDSTDFPSTAGAFQTSNDNGDAFVAKLNPAGTALIYSTYLGGNNEDHGRGIAVDGSGNAYVTGYTGSRDFPTTAGAFQTIYGAGLHKAFVVKLNAAGTALIYSTYLGGTGDDQSYGIGVNGSGNAYVTGDTNSTNFPTTPGAFQTNHANDGGGFDAFVAKLNAAGTALSYSTYVGGTGPDFATGIAVDGSANAYVTGLTDSVDFPITAGALQTSAQGAGKAFLTKLNTAGTAMSYSTYFGGKNTNNGGYVIAASAIAVDGSGNAYVTGETPGTDFPTSAGAFQTISGGNTDAFVAKFMLPITGSSSTAVSSSADPSVLGQNMTFTAVVVSTSGQGTPAGTVQFVIDGGNFGNPVPVINGSATINELGLGRGTHSVLAKYNGDSSNFSTSSAWLSGAQTVNQASSSTVVSSSLDPSIFGQGVTLTASVTPVSPSAGTPLGMVSEFAIPTANAYPRGITSGPDGNLWFTEENQIGRITPLGTVTEFGLPSAGGQGKGITAGPDGNLWFTEFTGNRIGRITPSGTVTEFAVPTLNSGPEEITVGPDGNLWFTELSGNKIGRITVSGTVTEFPLSTPFSQPVGITTGPDGALWFAEAGRAAGPQSTISKIGRITPSGTITEFATPNPYCFPEGITAGPDGNLWFTEDSTGTGIGKITPGGMITEFALSSPYSYPLLITAGPDGNLWFSESADIARISTMGTVTEFTVPTPSSGPGAITVGPDGNVWFAEYGGNQIARIAPLAGLLNGSLQFAVDGANYGNPVTLVGNSATLAAASLSAGTHAVTATYSGETNFMPSSGALPGGETVLKASTTSVSSAVNPSTFGQNVIFTVTVSPVSPPGVTPGGMVQFVLDGINYGSPVSMTGGSATITDGASNAGTHTVTAAYRGDSNFAGSTGTLSGGQTVFPPPHFSVSAPSTATTGSPFSITVTALDAFGNIASAYTGTVQLSSTDGAASLPVNNYTFTAGPGGDNGVHTFTATLNTAGNQKITAFDASNFLIGISNPIVTRGLVVSALTSTPTGFVATFGKGIDPTKINLYDVTLTGQVTNPGYVIQGSVVLSNNNQTLTFVTTNLKLPDDSYSLDLTSSGSRHPPNGAGAGFQDLARIPLDGAGNAGSADYTTTFTTSFSSQLTVVLPSFARGPGQPVNIDLVNAHNAGSSAGIPIQLSGAGTATTVSFSLSYDATLLTITPVTNNPSPAGGSYSVATSGSGANATATFTFTASGSVAASGPPITLGQLTASVPSTAAYKAKGLLHLGTVTVQNGTSPVPAVGQDAVQVIDFLGDAAGLGSYFALDAALMSSFENTGALFPAFPLADPNLIAGVDGAVDANSITQVLQFNLNKPVPGIPAYTGAPSNNPSGPDPALSIPSSGQWALGSGQVSVPVNIDDPHPLGSSGLMLATLALTYDPRVWSVSPRDIHLGAVPRAGTGWILAAPVVDASKGQIGITLYSLTPISSANAGSLVTLDFHAVAGPPVAYAPGSPIQLVAAVNMGGQEIQTALADSQGFLTLHEAPSSGSVPGLEGQIMGGAAAATAEARAVPTARPQLPCSMEAVSAVLPAIPGEEREASDLSDAPPSAPPAGTVFLSELRAGANAALPLGVPAAMLPWPTSAAPAARRFTGQVLADQAHLWGLSLGRSALDALFGGSTGVVPDWPLDEGQGVQPTIKDASAADYPGLDDYFAQASDELDA